MDQNININLINNLFSSLTSGKIILNFGDTEINVDITVNRKGNIIKQVSDKIIERIIEDRELEETKNTESNVSKDYVCGNEPYHDVVSDTDDEPVVDKLMSEELDKDEPHKHIPLKYYSISGNIDMDRVNYLEKFRTKDSDPIIDEDSKEPKKEETGWFKGEFRYGGKNRTSLHYYEDGIAVCDTGVVSRNHILNETTVKVDNPVTEECCKKCLLVLAKRKTATYKEIKQSKNVNATGWYLRMTDSRKGIYKHFYKDGHTICRNHWQLTTIDRETNLDTDKEYKICKVCIEKAKAHTRADISNKKVIKTLGAKDVITPTEMLERWNKNLVLFGEPVPLKSNLESDDVYAEAAKRMLVVYRKPINNIMRKLSSDNRMTVDSTTVKFYCKNKLVELTVIRNDNKRNSELSIKKINITDRTSPNQRITGTAYDMTSMVTRVILERSRKLKDEEED